MLLQMMTGLGLYRYVYGEREETGKRRKVLLAAAAAGIWALETYNANACIFSLIATWILVLVEGIWLRERCGGSLRRILCWNAF